MNSGRVRYIAPSLLLMITITLSACGVGGANEGKGEKRMDDREIIANAVSRSISGVTSVTVRPHQSGFTRGWRVDLERDRDFMSTEELPGYGSSVLVTNLVTAGYGS